LGFLHGVEGKFTGDVSETGVGPIFTGHEYKFTLLPMTNKDGNYSRFRNVFGKFTSHTVKNTQNLKAMLRV
jgi:hypothetical protein